MKGLTEILRAWEAGKGRGEPAVLVTVVDVAGSAYRRPGARMLVPATGEPVGLVSGGCLESDLAERAADVMRSGEPRTVVYDMRSPDDIVWGLGLGCDGEVRVLLERLDSDRPGNHLAFVERCRVRRERGVVATVFAVERGAAQVGERVFLAADASWTSTVEVAPLRDAMLDDARRVLSGGKTEVVKYERPELGSVSVLVELVEPPVSLVVFGAGADARPLVHGAAELGWSVTVLDHRPSYAIPEKFPDAEEVRVVELDALDGAGIEIDRATAVVLMTHHFLHDVTLLEYLVSSPAIYVGLLGPKKRASNLLRELEGRGIVPTPEQLDRVHGPVGIDIGSETPEEIALSVLAEIQAVMAGRRGGFLRDRPGPLHDWPS